MSGPARMLSALQCRPILPLLKIGIRANHLEIYFRKSMHLCHKYTYPARALVYPYA